jgi:hypothetical protein
VILPVIYDIKIFITLFRVFNDARNQILTMIAGSFWAQKVSMKIVELQKSFNHIMKYLNTLSDEGGQLHCTECHTPVINHCR